jgi:hypothetical protein
MKMMIKIKKKKMVKGDEEVLLNDGMEYKMDYEDKKGFEVKMEVIEEKEFVLFIEGLEK